MTSHHSSMRPRTPPTRRDESSPEADRSDPIGFDGWMRRDARVDRGVDATTRDAKGDDGTETETTDDAKERIEIDGTEKTIEQR